MTLSTPSQSALAKISNRAMPGRLRVGSLFFSMSRTEGELESGEQFLQLMTNIFMLKLEHGALNPAPRFHF